MNKLILEVFRSKNKEGAYLYVEKGQDLKELPEALISQLGTLTSAMTMLLTEDKKLARADAKKVMQTITENKFYLQMPPVDEVDEYLQKIPNAKLGLNQSH